jgi:hypothetical protein
MRYIFFKKSEYFDKNKIWHIKDIKHKYPKTEVGEIITFAKVYVKVNNGKTIQKGIMISGDEETALNNYLNMKEFNG